jgi:type I restriction-modification system DNA methylase subunit
MSPKVAVRKASSSATPEEFLSAAYDQLEYRAALGFYTPTEHPSAVSKRDIVEKFGWLKLAADLKADRLFFVNNYPVVLFFKLDTIDENKIRELHIKVWNMSRAPFFFVALPGELRLYSAYQEPIRDLDQWTSEQRWLKRVEEITKIAEELKDFSRSEIETERAFQSVKRHRRADEWLLRNLRLLRKRLEDSGLAAEHTLNLIGRSIFIKYLEDRKVLVDEYFADLTGGRTKSYTDVLENKRDTYTLFRKLRDDFNGNMFPLSATEEQSVNSERLTLLRLFLLGERMDEKQELFFWAYEFDIIPIELISSIYEEFYHAVEDADTLGTHYTPSVLVDFVLSQTFTKQRLESATVLDLACGSGIFLVEAFRRIAHSQMGKRGRRLSPKELFRLLRERIFGIDINGAAVQVAAFSLYLALLDFMEPSDIRRYRLPLLVHEPNTTANHTGFNLFAANSFWLTPTESQTLVSRLKQKRRYAGRALDERIAEWPQFPLGDRKFDLVVGNPPWGDPKFDEESRRAMLWCKAFDLPVGDEELSQCFIWRARSLLAPNGEVGLLVSSGVFFKHNETSRNFRRALLLRNQIKSVYNFAHVRKEFFSSAVSPFAIMFLTPTSNAEDALKNKVAYVAAKQSRMLENLQAIVLDKSDLHQISQRQLLERETLWKTLLWGNLQDVQLVAELETYSPLKEFASDYGRGYEKTGSNKYHTSQLGVDLELETASFTRRIDRRHLQVISPRRLHRLGNLALYHGQRLLIKRGITEDKRRIGDKHAEIEATLDDRSFAFVNSIIGIKCDDLSEENLKAILGILWSTLPLYFHFMTCSTWGFWHSEIHVDEHLRLPICLPKQEKLLKRIVHLVDRLMAADSADLPLLRPTVENEAGLEAELDETVFELYGLDEGQRELVRDFRRVTLDFFYDGLNSGAVKHPSTSELLGYSNAFLDIWQERLKPKGKEFEVRIYAPTGSPLVGISFDLEKLGYAQPIKLFTDDIQWNTLFHRLSKVLPEQLSRRVYLDRMVKVLDGSAMFVVKRAERRFWIKSQARQDAHELLTEVFKSEWQGEMA